MKPYLFIVLAFFSLLSCQPTETETTNLWEDETLRNLYDFQDRRDSKNLMPFLSSDQAQYRELAAYAFASVQDSTIVPALAQLLEDKQENVRVAAAYAIGQTRHPDGFAPLYQRISQEQSGKVKRVLLEAMGKCATEDTLPTLIGVQATNEVELAGQIWGLYRAGLNRISSQEGTRLALEALSDQTDTEVHLAIAHYLVRSNPEGLEEYEGQICQWAKQDPSPHVRMSLTGALRRITGDEVAATIAHILAKDSDLNVRVNAWRSAKPEHFAKIQSLILPALNANPNESAAAAAYLGRLNETDRAAVLTDVNLANLPARTHATLLGIAIDKGGIDDAESQLLDRIQHTSGRYDKAHFVSALGGRWSHLTIIREVLTSGNDPVVTTAAMDALTRLGRKPEMPTAIQANFAEVVKQGFLLTDLAAVALSSSIVLDENLSFLDAYWQAPEFRQTMLTAKEALVLPRDVESLMALEAAIYHLDGIEDEPLVQNPYNHPINWERLSEVSQGQEVEIKTTKGTIRWALQTDHAPGSVENFLTLVDSGYFNGKTFHRVVPNFVAQGGCPRGDGYGGMPYSIRSEFAPLRYKTGAVGLASAGKDTESCQWFITHSPTPHLDGRYTIFAYVTEGMEVVQALEVGDVIDEITLLP